MFLLLGAVFIENIFGILKVMIKNLKHMQHNAYTCMHTYLYVYIYI